MTAKGGLFEILLHPTTVEVVARQGSAPRRWIRMFDIQVKTFKIRQMYLSSEILLKRSPIERVEYSRIRQISLDSAAQFFNDIVDGAESMG